MVNTPQRPPLVTPAQVPLAVVQRFVTMAAAETPVLLFPANTRRAYWAIYNDQIAITLNAGVPNYTRYDVLRFSFGFPIKHGGIYKGLGILPGMYAESDWGNANQGEIFVWSPFTSTAAPWAVAGYEGVTDVAGVVPVE